MQIYNLSHLTLAWEGTLGVLLVGNGGATRQKSPLGQHLLLGPCTRSEFLFWAQNGVLWKCRQFFGDSLK